MFAPRDIAAIAVCSALWGILNALISPIFWQLTHMPFLCDMLAFAALILVIWWTRKLGAASLVGLIVTVMTFSVNPAAFQMLGFLAASIVFDVMARFLGYERLFKNLAWGGMMLAVISVLSAGLAGAVIGSFVMGLGTPQTILIFAGLHAMGGLIGAIIGVVLVKALLIRHVKST